MSLKSIATPLHQRNNPPPLWSKKTIVYRLLSHQFPPIHPLQLVRTKSRILHPFAAIPTRPCRDWRDAGRAMGLLGQRIYLYLINQRYMRTKTWKMAITVKTYASAKAFVMIPSSSPFLRNGQLFSRIPGHAISRHLTSILKHTSQTCHSSHSYMPVYRRANVCDRDVGYDRNPRTIPAPHKIRCIYLKKSSITITTKLESRDHHIIKNK